MQKYNSTNKKNEYSTWNSNMQFACLMYIMRKNCRQMTLLLSDTWYPILHDADLIMDSCIAKKKIWYMNIGAYA